MAGRAGESRTVDDGTANSVSLLISILVRYPEIATVKFVPEGKVLKFTFMGSRPVSEDVWMAFQDGLRERVQAYAALVHGMSPTLQVERRDYAEVSLIEISRDASTLTQEEISLIIEYARAELGSSLITEDLAAEDAFDEDLVFQDEMIENMLEDLKETIQHRNLIGFREDGRVLVFNKQNEKQSERTRT
ncbi:MAG: hypothetical protein QME92_05315 [Bacillota bacterium]|nr:hypothetical protein [Bacillota bacterium]